MEPKKRGPGTVWNGVFLVLGGLLLVDFLVLGALWIVDLDLAMNLPAALGTAVLLLLGLIGYPLAGRLQVGRTARRVLLAGVLCDLALVGLYVLAVVSIVGALSKLN